MKINWIRLIITIIWLLAGPVSIIIFMIIGKFTFSFIHFYFPLALFISSILYLRWVYLCSTKEREALEIWRKAEIERLILERKRVEDNIRDLEKLKLLVEKRYEREDKILEISIQILKDEIEKRKGK